MTALFAFLSGPFGRIGLYAAAAVAIVVGAWFVVDQHDRRVLAEQTAREAAAVASQQVADMRRAVEAANAEAIAANARASAVANVKRDIARAPASSGCAASPAIRAALDGVRGSGSGAGAAGSPGGAVGVPAATGAPRTAPR